MKQFACITLLTTMLFSAIALCSCEPATWTYSPEELMNEVVKVELVYFPTVENPVKHKEKLNNVKSINFDEATFIQELSQDQYSDFFDKLSGVVFDEDYYSIDYPMGYTLLMHERDGEILVLSWYATSDNNYCLHAKYDSNGNFIEQFTSFLTVIQFEQLLLEFFNVSPRDL